MCSFIFTIFVLAAHLARSHGAYYPITRNPNLLERWAAAEIDFVDQLRYSSQEILLMKVVRDYIHDFEESFHTLKDYHTRDPVNERAEAVTSNPIAVYRMFRRLAYQFPGLRKQVQSLNAVLFHRFHERVTVQTMDVQDAIAAILRINHVYNFKESSLADGVFGSIETGTVIQGVHCYEIGLEALRLDMFTLSIEWLEVALTKTERDYSINSGIVKSLLDVAIHKHDEDCEKRGFFYPYCFTKKLHPVISDKSSRNRYKQRDFFEDSYATAKDMGTRYFDLKFAVLCSGKNLQSDEEKSELFCWYECKRDLYWLIGPLKMEFLARNPDVVHIYDVIGEKHTQDLKKTVQEELQPSEVVNIAPGAAPGAHMLSDVRTSVNGWIGEYSHPTLASVSRTMEMVTGLKVIGETASDRLQVASYTSGGHYAAHLDALMAKGYGQDQKGERIATFLYYLEEPELGGQTAFTDGGVAALPIKGSAVFWYDIYNDGETDFRTHHGACPVVLGKKWVANKWVRYFDQFLVRKCGLQPRERYQVPVNNVFTRYQ